MTSRSRASFDEAMARVKWALRLDGKLAEARRLLARLQTEKGQAQAALASYQRLFEAVDSESSREIAPEFVASVQYFADRGRLSPGEAVATLTPLLRMLPENPDLALGAARLELQAAGENVPAGVARVWRRLDEFRNRTEGQSLRIPPGGLYSPLVRLHPVLGSAPS